MAVTSSKLAPFAAMIRDRRKARDLTQGELAQAVGCSQQAIEKIERGITIWSSYFPSIFLKLGLDLNLLAERSPSEGRSGKRDRRKTPARNVYLSDWRQNMKGDLKKLAKIAGVSTTDEYLYLEQHPYKLSLEQLDDLAVEIGITPDQVWFPPPKRG